jgi:hypothetical protein
MSFITREELEGYRPALALANESAASVRAKAATFSTNSSRITIFLSHSHKDKDLIIPALGFLQSHGVEIYVDWMDAGMPDVVSGETAKQIKDRIKQHRKFLVLVTENSKESRWVPWELGYADSTRGMEHIAVFPVAEKYDFAQNEYMKIYPRINHVGSWDVWTDDPFHYISLRDWLKN